MDYYNYCFLGRNNITIEMTFLPVLLSSLFYNYLDFISSRLLIIVIIISSSSSMQPIRGGVPSSSLTTRGMIAGFSSYHHLRLTRIKSGSLLKSTPRYYSNSFDTCNNYWNHHVQTTTTTTTYLSNFRNWKNNQQPKRIRTYQTLTRATSLLFAFPHRRSSTTTTTTPALSLSKSNSVLSSSSSSSTGSSIIEEAEQEVTKVIQWLNNIIQQSNGTSVKTPLVLRTQLEVQEYLQQNNVDTFLFDCDGVLYRSPDVIPGARECIMSLLQNEKSVYFITNNAASNRQQLRTKLTNILNLPDPNLLTDDMMITSSYSCAQYIKEYFTNNNNNNNDPNKNNNNDNNRRIPTIYVIGSTGLCDEIQSITGYNVIRTSDDESYSMTREELAEYEFPTEETIDAVVIGHDTTFHFRKLCIATVILQNNPTAILIATNMDSYDLVGKDGRHIPGNGALVSAVAYASTKRAIINVGKPSTTLFQLLLQTTQYRTIIDPTRTIMIGDRIDTDIKFGIDNNMITALVMTGVTTAETLQSIGLPGTDDEPQPSIILSHVGLIKL